MKTSARQVVVPQAEQVMPLASLRCPRSLPEEDCARTGIPESVDLFRAFRAVVTRNHNM